MKKILSMISRMVLALGVLVALTPCNICKASTRLDMPQMKACGMGSMSGMKCCQSAKSQSPFCKIMDQKSVVSASHGLALATVPVMTAVNAEVFLATLLVSPDVSRSDDSPPRIPLSLRI